MFEKGLVVSPEMIVKHDDKSGLLYQINNIGRVATGYETTHQLSDEQVVNYTQLEDGDFPAGTIWNREIEDFRKNFTPHMPVKSELTDSELIQQGFTPRMAGDGNTLYFAD